MTAVTRKYEKRRRAELEEDTKRRITEALVRLHGTIGPVRTTVHAVASEAGVQRATVYRHFPDEASMYAACAAHWAEQNPFPDPAAWKSAQRPVVAALRELYAFFTANESILSNVFRDETLVECMRPSVKAMREYFRAASDALASRFGRRRILRAAVAHALSFSTWYSLTQENGLSNEQAVSLMAGLVERQTAHRRR